MFKYRVKFYCYHYNTGSANNGSYWNWEDFDTLQQADHFKKKLLYQNEMNMKYENGSLKHDKFQKFINSDDYYDVEDGYIQDYYKIHIVKYFPKREEPLTVDDYAK